MLDRRRLQGGCRRSPDAAFRRKDKCALPDVVTHPPSVESHARRNGSGGPPEPGGSRRRYAAASALLGWHEGADDPEERDEDADDEHHPVALADRKDPEGHQQHEIDRAQEYDSGG